MSNRKKIVSEYRRGTQKLPERIICILGIEQESYTGEERKWMLVRYLYPGSQPYLVSEFFPCDCMSMPEQVRREYDDEPGHIFWSDLTGEWLKRH